MSSHSTTHSRVSLNSVRPRIRKVDGTLVSQVNNPYDASAQFQTLTPPARTLSSGLSVQATYKILGGDGKEYGPATLEQMLGWVRDGRVSSATQVWRSDQNAWVTARDLPELQLAAPPPVATTPGGGMMSIDRQHTLGRVKS